MHAKKRLIKEIESLGSHNILRVYDLVLTLKKQEERAEPKKTSKGYLRTRYALRSCKGSLSDSIIEERNERL